MTNSSKPALSNLFGVLVDIGMLLLEKKIKDALPESRNPAQGSIDSQIRSANYNAEILRSAATDGLANVHRSFMNGLK